MDTKLSFLRQLCVKVSIISLGRKANSKLNKFLHINAVLVSENKYDMKSVPQIYKKDARSII